MPWLSARGRPPDPAPSGPLIGVCTYMHAHARTPVGKLRAAPFGSVALAPRGGGASSHPPLAAKSGDCGLQPGICTSGLWRFAQGDGRHPPANGSPMHRGRPG